MSKNLLEIKRNTECRLSSPRRRAQLWIGVSFGFDLGIIFCLACGWWFLKSSPLVVEIILGNIQVPSDSSNSAPTHYIVKASICDVHQRSQLLLESGKSVRYRVKIIRIIDGDTLIVFWHGKEYAVRMLGINAPEKGEPGFAEAANYLTTLVGDDGHIDLEFGNSTSERDNFGRLLAYLWGGEVNLNAKMLEAGQAVVYHRDKKKKKK